MEVKKMIAKCEKCGFMWDWLKLSSINGKNVCQSCLKSKLDPNLKEEVLENGD